jgi:hypothetical protein
MTKTELSGALNDPRQFRRTWIARLPWLPIASKPTSKAVLAAILSAIVLLVPRALVAQQTTASRQPGTLRGQVTDPSGAAVANATVSAALGNGGANMATTDQQGEFAIRGLTPGVYSVTVVAQGFAPFTNKSVVVTAGKAASLDVKLALESQQQHVQVSAQAQTLSVESGSNASQTVLRGKDLQALSDDPDELQTELQALAGPSVGPNGGQIYIDGFTGGNLPPKASIREIRINNNPFSPQYDTLGYGRIEIFTKPGTDQYHGRVFLFGNDSALNSRTPFLLQVPSYHSWFFEGNVGGPLSKKASFFFNVERRAIDDLSVINAPTLDSNLNQTVLTDAVRNPRTRYNISPRIDYQVSKNNTLTARYQYVNDTETNNGLSQQTLPSLALDYGQSENTVQLSDSQVVSPTTVNETRFQYSRNTSFQNPLEFSLPEIVVQGNFTGGGNSSGNQSMTFSRYEGQNYTSMQRGKHFLTFGGQLDDVNELQSTTADFNGRFTFGAACVPVSGQATCQNVNALTNYQKTQQDLRSGQTMSQIRSEGYGPSLFTINAGIPALSSGLIYTGLYVDDSYHVSSKLLLDYGLRFESQNHIGDHADWAPRIGLSYGLGGRGGPPKTVIRAGFGLFYQRFTDDLLLTALRLNGTNQQQYQVSDPNFYPTVPPASQVQSLATSSSHPTIYSIDPSLRAPYFITSAVGVERQLTKTATMSVTYLNSRGEHEFLTNDINAPLPGTFDPANPSSGVRPYGPDNIYQYQSVGIFKQNQLITNFNVRAGQNLSLFGVYTLNYAKSDTNGANSFPSNPYDILADYGRAQFDVRNRVFVGGSIGMRWGVRLSPFVMLSSGLPYNLTLGQDLYGTGQYNARPAYATSSTPSNDAVVTPYGTLNKATPPSATPIPTNLGTGPAQFSANLRLAKTFGFGRGHGGGFNGGGFRGRGGLGGRGLGSAGPNPFAGPSSEHRYNFTVGIMAHNIFNNVNYAPPIGNLSSVDFGHSIALASGFFGSQDYVRRLDLNVSFSF